MMLTRGVYKTCCGHGRGFHSQWPTAGLGESLNETVAGLFPPSLPLSVFFSHDSLYHAPPLTDPPLSRAAAALSPKWSGDEGYSLWPCVVTPFL